MKNIVLTGFGKVTLLDLDTIDLSNLNRQFLFKKKDVKQSKAMVSSTLIVSSYMFLMYAYLGSPRRLQPKPLPHLTQM